MNTFDKQLQEHAEKYKSLIMTVHAPKKGKAKLKPQTESSMKGLIDLYKVINDSAYCRVQDKIPNSDCVGLTKE